jgi:hypothetical protein
MQRGKSSPNQSSRGQVPGRGSTSNASEGNSQDYGFSTSVPVDGKAWRHAWRIEHMSGMMEELPALPPPEPLGIEGLPQVSVVGLLQLGPGRLRLEMFTPVRWLNGPEVAYAASVLAALADLVGPLSVEGRTDHPLLRATALSRAAVAQRASKRPATGRGANAHSHASF